MDVACAKINWAIVIAILFLVVHNATKTFRDFENVTCLPGKYIFKFSFYTVLQTMVTRVCRIDSCEITHKINSRVEAKAFRAVAIIS